MLDKLPPTPPAPQSAPASGSVAAETAASPKKARFKTTRRGLLIGTGATLGLLVGYALWPRQYPNAWQAGEGETLLGPWVKIGPDGTVTVPVPQAEMGQGIMSGFAQIVADELGANWTQMAVEPAPWHPAYAQVGMVQNATENMPPMLRGLASRLGKEAVQRLNVHLTGGSNSMMNYHGIVRKAAAEARQMLVEAVAAKWGVSAAELDTKNGFVLYKANRLSFADAIKLVDPDIQTAEPVLRDAKDNQLIGQALPRLDLPSKVDGSARFGADVRLPGMQFAAIRHGPIGATLARASAPKGVTLVKGENWVAVTGATNWAAKQALDKVEAEFTAPAKPLGPWILDELKAAAQGSIEAKPLVEEGDVEAVLGGKDRVVTAAYEVPYLAHVCMEPMTATARFVDDKLEIWGPTQSLTLAHMAVSKALDLEAGQITIYPTLMGGGFGRKAEADAMVEAALIAKAVGKPVQLLWSREEDILNDRYRPPAHGVLRAALDKGEIAGLDIRIATPALSANFAGRAAPFLAGDPEKPSAQDVEGITEIPYALGAIRATHVPVQQPAPLGFWRSVGNSFTAFMVESFIDELAVAAGEDPLDFRLSKLAAHPRHQNVLRAAADAARWPEPLPKGFARGLALHESFGSICAMVVTAGVVEGRIRITEVVSALDCGRALAPDSVKAQLQGAAVMGLSAALREGVSFEDGQALETNFHAYQVAKMADVPSRFVTVIVNSGAKVGGVGEPGLPPAAPALANALARATGKRARTLPLAAVYEG